VRVAQLSARRGLFIGGALIANGITKSVCHGADLNVWWMTGVIAFKMSVLTLSSFS
jgi:hypothetical protein